jgi:NAD(P)-dependent dehydrogenase (short-subunit alcohol dehydrogenase family)
MNFDRTTTATEVVRGLDLSGRTILVTGGGAGIGAATAGALAGAGARVIVADINDVVSRETIAEHLRRNPGARIDFLQLDLGSLDSVRRVASDLREQIDTLDVLVCNAGLMACPLAHTVDGHERQFAVNFLGHYLLARLLEPSLARASAARVVSVSSIGHRRSDIVWDDIDFRRREYDRWSAYGQSKTACSLLAVAIDHLWRPKGIRSNTMNPGGSNTGLHQFLTDDERRRQGFLDNANKVPDRWRSPEQCAATSVWLAVGTELEGVGGRYFEGFAEAPAWDERDPMKGVRPYALSQDNSMRLWRVAAGMVGLEP